MANSVNDTGSGTGLARMLAFEGEAPDDEDAKPNELNVGGLSVGLMKLLTRNVQLSPGSKTSFTIIDSSRRLSFMPVTVTVPSIRNASAGPGSAFHRQHIEDRVA